MCHHSTAPGRGPERAVSTDAAAIGALALRAFEDPWSDRLLREELARSSSRAWVIRRSVPPSPLEGFLMAEAAISVGEIHILSIGVCPRRRRLGLGAALLRAALDAATHEGIAWALLELRASNVAALGLYRDHGFVVAGRRPRYYRNAEDAILMTLELSERARS